ncbi:MAG TPA: ABC transporter substrate-binding protein [Ktedonobacterales bacterium]
MTLYDRQQRVEVDQLVDDYARSGMSRREFLRRAMIAGLSASAASALLAACGGGSAGTTSTPKSVDLLATWGGTELDSFNAAVAPFTSQTGISVKVESTRDLNATLTTRIQGNNPPDIAILPNPGKMQQLAQQNHLIALDDLVDMSKIRNDYASAWINLGSYKGKLYSIFYKAANKGTIWYNPSQFQSNNFTIPKTWDDLISLSDQIANSGKYPWSMGVASGAASGWPGADWIDQIFLADSGPDLYDQWVAHKIPWTHSAVKSAFQKFGQIAAGKHYINGAPQSILAGGFQEATYAPFQNPPTAYMNYLGDFAAGFITGQFKDLQPGTGFNFFAFPTVTSQYAGAVTGGADLVTALKNNGAVKQLVQYLASKQPQEIWIKRGGFTSANKSVDLSTYPDAVSKASAQMLVSASTFRFGADDLMPSQVEDAFWKGVLTYIGNPGQLDSVLSDIESTAAQAYTS